MLSEKAFGRMTLLCHECFSHASREKPFPVRPMSMPLSCRSIGASVFWTMTLLGSAVSTQSGVASAQTGGLSHSPAEIVKKYFELDQKGAKLDSMSLETLAPYRNWDTEPVWGKVVVIREFSVAEHHRDWEVVNRLEVVIPVTFTVIGSVYLETAGFLPEATVEEIHVRVKSVRNRWHHRTRAASSCRSKADDQLRARGLGEGNRAGQAGKSRPAAE
jgi:hypothetical protein